MMVTSISRDLMLVQDNTRETRKRASEKIAAIRKFFMLSQGGVHRDVYECHYCDEWVPRAQMTVDHIVPWSVCHITALWNSAFVCHTCNMMKGNEIDWCICERCQFARDRWLEIQVEDVICVG